MTMEDPMAIAHGDQPADMLLRNSKVVNVYSGEILTCLALPVIPAGKITDKGLADANRFEPVDLFGR